MSFPYAAEQSAAVEDEDVGSGDLPVEPEVLNTRFEFAPCQSAEVALMYPSRNVASAPAHAR